MFLGSEIDYARGGVNVMEAKSFRKVVEKEVALDYRYIFLRSTIMMNRKTGP